MKGSEDWMMGWNDHRDFIASYRTRNEVGWFLCGIGVGALLFVLLAGY